jgi:alkaline phosphatase
MISIAYRRLALLALAASFGCTGEPASDEPSAVIASGAGAADWTLAGLASADLAKARMPVSGLMDTRRWDHEVTGNAPAATAIATGVRSFMGAVGVGPDSLPRESVLEVAHGLEWATGLVTTGRITDPTPAAFAAHVPSQSQRLEIFQQMMDLPVQVLLGDGARVVDVTPRRRALDLRAQIWAQYRRVSSVPELRRAAETDSMLLGFFAPEELPPADRRSPTLADMTEVALKVLDRDPDGVFLMVENKGSDTYALRNGDREAIVADMLAFDDALGVGLEYQSRNPGTLILALATHETGGIHLLVDDDRNLVLENGTGSATGVRVPIFAIGPGAERFGGLIDNDEVGRALLDLLRAARAVRPNPDERP